MQEENQMQTILKIMECHLCEWSCNQTCFRKSNWKFHFIFKRNLSSTPSQKYNFSL